MRITILTLIFISNIGLAQNNLTELKFDTKYYEAVDKWVAFPKNETDSIFNYGFIYIDEQAGFTYQFGSTFTIDSLNNYLPEVIDSTINAKYRIDQNWKPVSIIPQEKLKELNLPTEPEWLKYYKENSNSVSYLKNIGYHYNHVGATNLALKPLLKAYEIEPHFDGLEFELSFAYNALGQYEKAIAISENAIENNPKNFYFYRELGFSYKNLSKIEEAEKAYRKGIKISENDFEKSEMAVNMAQSYFELRNKEKFDEWAKLTRKYAEKGSRYAQFIDLFEQNWNKK
jgi:tetratricopeptide (TPR) repeat protein